MKPIGIILGIVAAGIVAPPAFCQDGNANSTNKPNVQIRVHKKTDKDGNVVSYDSTYSYSYSGNKMDTAQMHDLMKEFGENMNGMLFPMNDSASGFMSDPMFQMFNNGNIDMSQMQKAMEQQMLQMQQMMQNNGWPMNGMDSLSPQPVKPCPAPKCKKHPVKKTVPKQNNSDQGVQI
jgi:hypothetical protein